MHGIIRVDTIMSFSSSLLNLHLGHWSKSNKLLWTVNVPANVLNVDQLPNKNNHNFHFNFFIELFEPLVQIISPGLGACDVMIQISWTFIIINTNNSGRQLCPNTGEARIQIINLHNVKVNRFNRKDCLKDLS